MARYRLNTPGAVFHGGRVVCILEKKTCKAMVVCGTIMTVNVGLPGLENARQNVTKSRK